MRNLGFSFILLLISFSALAAECEVYGISDSPQHLTCELPGKKLILDCDQSTSSYLLNGGPVEVAYHEEVEDGPVPLVFKTSQSTLRVMMHTSRNIQAEFQEGRKILKGRCRL